MTELELWGGHECTVNRVGDRFYDQTVASGHAHRIDDLDRFAKLGLKTLRYPVLWERVAPETPETCDWRWTDVRLARLRELQVRPIAGLLHHGSGPRYTSLSDEGFAPAFARFARAAAERYPWITDWTPINEPLTTARFSALYGHWYPHRRDERAFWAAVLNQIEAVGLAMREIRAVNPEAQLIQTEDLGRTYATRAMAHQADFDNARRWMTWDLLCGRVTADHPLWSRLDGFGFGDRLRRLHEAPCPPNVIGVNHYLTSDRFLDHRAAAYPPERQGGNGFMAFADVEAIRVTAPAPAGLEGVLDEAWRRYGRPLAVTEAHNGCTREEQVRWLREAWDVAERLRARGADVRAVTAWALLGSHNWNGLLTREGGHYEPGAFDVTGPTPRATALAGEIKRLATGRGSRHPATEGPGWWRRDVRFEFKPVFRWPVTPEARPSWRNTPSGERPLLITGATGTLGRAIARACEWRGIAYKLTTRAELSLDDAGSIARALDDSRAWGVVNAAGWVRVDEAQSQPAACFAANHLGAVRLARACAERRLPFVGFSSDLVFNGAKGSPYVERDAPTPLNVYGTSKMRAEREILAGGGSPLIIRTAAFFSPYDPHNFAAHVQRTLGEGRRLDAPDVTITPTYVPDLVDRTLDLLIDGCQGLRHVVNDGVVSWAEFARRLARAMDLDADLVDERPAAYFDWPAVRPPNAAMTSELQGPLPSLDDAIARFAALAHVEDLTPDTLPPPAVATTAPFQRVRRR